MAKPEPRWKSAACPTCGAKVGDRCRIIQAHHTHWPTKPHAARERAGSGRIVSVKPANLEPEGGGEG